MREATFGALPEPGDGFLYLATPYTDYPGGRQMAFRLAALFAGMMIRRGHSVFSPIAHSHPIARSARIDETDHATWTEAAAPLMAAAAGLVVVTMEGWNTSRGVAHEIAAFREAGKPTWFASPDALLALNGAPAEDEGATP